MKFACAAVACVLVFTASSVAAQSPPLRQVLVLQSFDRGNITIDSFTANFRVELDQASNTPVNVIQVVVGQSGLAGASEQAVVDYIRATFAGRPKPDLIVTIAGPASAFARRNRQQLFPETPLLLAAVDRRYVADAPLGDNEVEFLVDNQQPAFFEDMLRLLPRTRQILMVMGSEELGRFWQRQLEKDLAALGKRVTFIWSGNLSWPEVLRRSASLPPDSAVFYLAVGTDASGAAYADERVLADLHAMANAPLFGFQSVYMGAGVVGGSLMSIDEMSRTAAQTAIRLLNGTPPQSVSVPVQVRSTPTFDWRELQRWGIPESRLPPGSIVRYRGPSLWREYRTAVLSATGALLVQSLLIGGLLYQRLARQRAEVESRKNLALAADTNRRATMSALTSSISHELGQPLSAMMHNAHALQMMVTANRATPGMIGEILADIEDQGLRATQIIDRHRAMLRSRQIEVAPTDLHDVIHESLALVSHDLAARQIECAVDLTAQPCVIHGDPVLLQQVFVNLMVNAMDAMADTPPPRRRMTIRTTMEAAKASVSVRDTGTGLPPQIDGRLFMPFVTTKSHGLGVGLTIVQTIIQTHDGRIEARNNPDGGATFTVTLPCVGPSARASQ